MWIAMTDPYSIAIWLQLANQIQEQNNHFPI